MNPREGWRFICELADILPYAGVCALIGPPWALFAVRQNLGGHYAPAIR